jgi:hypothetical protein
MSYDYTTLNVGKLDYTSIRNNLVSFLQKYPQFQSYDFANQASAINLFIDILSANTAYNGYYLHSVLTNSFPITATTKRALLLDLNLRGGFVADSVSARSTVSLQNAGATAIPIFSAFTAVQTNGAPCLFYNLEEIPVTGSNIVTVEMVAGKNIASFNNFDSQSLVLELPLTYDPTAVRFSTKTTALTDDYWTRVDRFSNSSGSKIFTVLNGPNVYYVTTNIAGAQVPDPAVTVDAIESSGTLGNSAQINGARDYTDVTIVSHTTPSGGRNSVSKDYLKTYVPYVTSTNDRLVTETDYIDATYTFLLANGISVTKTDIQVSSPAAGQINIYVSTLNNPTVQSQLMTSYLATRKMAGISLTYGP